MNCVNDLKENNQLTGLGFDANNAVISFSYLHYY